MNKKFLIFLFTILFVLAFPWYASLFLRGDDLLPMWLKISLCIIIIWVGFIVYAFLKKWESDE